MIHVDPAYDSGDNGCRDSEANILAKMRLGEQPPVSPVASQVRHWPCWENRAATPVPL